MHRGPIVSLMGAASVPPATPHLHALTGTWTRMLAAVMVTVIHALDAFAKKLPLVAVVIKYKNTFILPYKKIKTPNKKRLEKGLFCLQKKIEM